MSRNHVARALALVVSIVLQGGTGIAAETEEPPDENVARARTVVQRAARALESAQTMRVRLEMEYDVVQKSGVHLEFGGTRRLVLRRPDRLRVEGARRDGTRSEFYFDGRTGTLSHPAHHVYSRAEMGPTIDAALDTLEDELGVPMPAGDLLRSDLAKFLEDRTEAGLWVGVDSLDDVSCDHVALEGETVDAQLWVSREEPALIRRMVLTYVNEAGSPQFRASFRDWQLNANAPDELFVFTPTDGMEQVPFVSLGGASSGETPSR
jgi:hypothetical protein